MDDRLDLTRGGDRCTKWGLLEGNSELRYSGRGLPVGGGSIVYSGDGVGGLESGSK